MQNTGLLKDKLKFGFTVLILTYLLTNYVLPTSKYLLNFGILTDTIKELNEHYNFFINGLKSVSLLYLSFTIAIIAVLVLLYFSGKILKKYENSFKVLSLFGNLPLFVAVVGYSLVFNGTFGEVFLIIISALIFLMNEYFKSVETVSKEYFEIFHSLRMKNANTLFLNLFLANLKKGLYKVHIKLWSVLIVYEFVNSSGVFGQILRDVIDYQDFSKFVVIAFAVSLTIVLFNFVIKVITGKYINWDKE